MLPSKLHNNENLVNLKLLNLTYIIPTTHNIIQDPINNIETPGRADFFCSANVTITETPQVIKERIGQHTIKITINLNILE